MRGIPNQAALMLTFSHEGILYGVYASGIVEVTELPALTLIPCEDKAVKGLFAYKGEILPALSFSKLCGGTECGEENTCIILQSESGITAALLVVQAEDVITVSEENRKAVSDQMKCGAVQFSSVMNGDKTVMIVDIDKTFSEISIN